LRHLVEVIEQSGCASPWPDVNVYDGLLCDDVTLYCVMIDDACNVRVRKNLQAKEKRERENERMNE
jgi:hypothetical protein